MLRLFHALENFFMWLDYILCHFLGHKRHESLTVKYSFCTNCLRSYWKVEDK